VTRRRGRRSKKLLDDLKDRRGYSHLKEEALDRTVRRNRCVRGVGPVVRLLNERIYYYYYYYYYYYLLQLSFHSVTIVLTLATNKNKYI
jgi:hypothetical protein